MKRIHVAAAVLNQTPLDWTGNAARITAALRAARAQGATIVCLPELCISGYGCEDAFLGAGVARRSLAILRSLLPETAGMVVSFGLPLLYRNGLFNCAALAVDGKLVGFVAKHHLAGDGVYYEPRWFKPWPVGARAMLEDLGGVPLGDVLFDIGGVRLGFEICEDAWVASRPGAALAALGVDVILNPSASHFAFDKIDTRRRFVLEGSRAFSTSYVYANHLGNDAGRIIWDGGGLIASGGRMLAEGRRFGFEDWSLTSAVIDVESTRMQQARTGSFRPDLVTDDAQTVKVDFAWPEQVPAAPNAKADAWESGPTRKEEEFTRAVTLALFDYMRKSASRGFVVSLSGGADSTAVVALVALMVRRALRELTPQGFQTKVPYMPGLTADGALRSLLLTAYQGSINSSTVTRDAARTVAEGFGSEHHELEIDTMVRHYVGVVSNALGRPLEWKTDDLALQNIQARVRGPSVWMFANVRGALLLATSNRSEAAVGYSTMDGDTCGGLSPIAGIDKAFLRHWLGWLMRQGPEGDGAFPFLKAVVDQRSTPELRPQQAKQVSEGDLMPFAVLDAIERAAIRDKREPVDVLAIVGEQFPNIGRDQLVEYIDRFFTLWSRNQWKRERYAPSFHLDDENLDPKTWCRFPILSAGFKVELAELHGKTSAP
ncbi:MAG: NAD(+) synthase [Myxococcota bacterium]